MKIILLGTGTSTGIPIIGCKCSVCVSSNPKNNRTRASAYFEVDGVHLLIDTSTDFRQQMLTNKIPRVDAVLYTHAHADHIHGIDDLRAFNIWQQEEIPVFMDDASFEKMSKYFNYIFCPYDEEGGSGFIPRLVRNPLHPQFEVKGIPVQSFPLVHGPGFSYGYRLHNVAYCTDLKSIPETSEPYLKNLDLLILDALRYKPHPTHLSLTESLAIVEKFKPKRTVFIHMNHDLDHDIVNSELPAGMELGFDAMSITI